MLLRVEPSSSVPIYVQLGEQIRLGAASGRIAAGEKLPGVRELALELGINLQTVAKAYAELTREGVLEARRGVGTFVSERALRSRSKDADELIREELRKACRAGLTAGIDVDALKALLDDVWRDERKTWRP
jgi:GntR family transcriptional regulator